MTRSFEQQNNLKTQSLLSAMYSTRQLDIKNNISKTIKFLLNNSFFDIIGIRDNKRAKKKNKKI